MIHMMPSDHYREAERLLTPYKDHERAVMGWQPQERDLRRATAHAILALVGATVGGEGTGVWQMAFAGITPPPVSEDQ